MSSAVPDGGTWKQAVDTQGRTYYYHAVTKQTVWVLPPGAVLAAPKKRRSTTASGSTVLSPLASSGTAAHTQTRHFCSQS